MSSPLPHPARFGSNSGQSFSRRDGVAKVTGTATFAADNHPEGLLYAVYVPATIARGKVSALDVDAARAHPGVVEVITPANRPPLAGDPDSKNFMFAFRFEALQDDMVRYANQPIALVLGETIEAATEGARLLNPQYEALPARVGLDGDAAYKIETGAFGRPGETSFGDIEAGHAAAVVAVDVTYETSAQYHNAMETHAVVAAWDGDHLTLDMPNQAIVMSRAVYGYYFGIPAENVLIRSPYLGGGFGSKAIANGPQMLAILAARMMGRPVKLMLPRAQMFGPVGHRGATRQQLRIGSDAQGTLVVLDHASLGTTSTFDDFVE
ncbi:MAG: molybdopterin cofactor-binding domain-containing protein, partial [Cypionkella sp.]